MIVAKVAKIPGPILFVTGLLGMGCFLASVAIFTAGFRDGLFLRTFAERIRTAVGVDGIAEMAERIRKDVKAERRNGFPLGREDFPKAIQGLYPKPPYGTVVFDNDKNVLRIQILWGGPIFRWGIEISTGPVNGGVQKGRVMGLSKDTVCFIEGNPTER
jgi:hypothetical protein